MTSELDIRGDTLGRGDVGELLGDTLSIASIVEAGLRRREIVLVVRVLDVNEEVTSLAHHLESSTKKIPGGAHLGWVDISLRKHASSEKGCNLESIDTVVLGLASMNRFHVKSMTKDEVNTFPCTEVGEPVPGEDTLDRDDEVFSEWSDGFQENVTVRGQVSMKKDFSFLVEHAGIHVSCVKVDATVILMGYVVESHQALSFRG